MPNNDSAEKEKVKSIPIQDSWRIFFWEALLFSFTLGLGIATAFKITKVFEVKKITIPQLPPSKFVSLEIRFLTGFIFYFLLTTLFILFIIRFVKFEKGRRAMFRTLFILAVFLGGLLFLELWIFRPFSFILISLLIFWWWKSPSILNQDILMILGLAGIGSTLGLALQPAVVIVLLIIFSIYDYIAVYKTKHMVKMAKAMIESRAILALVVPPNIFGFKESLEKIEPGGKFLILGGGDIVFPLLLSASLVPRGILDSLIVAFFALVGLFFSFLIFTSQKIRQPIPALPPIVLFSMIGFLLSQIF